MGGGGCLLVDNQPDIQSNDCVFMAGTSVGRPLEATLPGSAIHRLPDHLKCMMPFLDLFTEDQLSEVVELVLEVQDVFVGQGRKVGFTDFVKYKINMEDAVSTGGRQSFLENEHIITEVEKLTQEGQIRPCKSPSG